MRISNTIKALRERCPIFNERVFGAAEFNALPEVINPESVPAAYVFTLNESPEELQRTENYFYQEITATVAVVVLVPTGDERGQAGADLVEDCKEQIFKAILSWSPTDDNKAIYEYSAYNLLRIVGGCMFVQLEFICTYAIKYDDTRQPDEIAAQVGNFATMNMDVDMIGKDNKPDGQIDVKAQFKDLW